MKAMITAVVIWLTVAVDISDQGRSVKLKSQVTRIFQYNLHFYWGNVHAPYSFWECISLTEWNSIHSTESLNCVVNYYYKIVLVARNLFRIAITLPPCVKFRKYFNFAGMSENTFQSFNMEVYENFFFSWVFSFSSGQENYWFYNIFGYILSFLLVRRSDLRWNFPIFLFIWKVRIFNFLSG